MRFFESRPTVTSRRSPYCRAPSVGQRGRSTRCQRRSSWDLDGAYYVGLLTGFPFLPNASSVYRVLPCAPPEVFAAGLQTVIDLDFGPDGSLYVLQHTSGVNPPPNVFGGPGQGLIIKIAPDGTRTTVVTGLTRPTSLLVDWDGVIYVTNNGVTVGAGEVWRIEQ